jgi:hypothetical protein
MGRKKVLHSIFTYASSPSKGVGWEGRGKGLERGEFGVRRGEGVSICAKKIKLTTM